MCSKQACQGQLTAQHIASPEYVPYLSIPFSLASSSRQECLAASDAVAGQHYQRSSFVTQIACSCKLKIEVVVIKQGLSGSASISYAVFRRTHHAHKKREIQAVCKRTGCKPVSLLRCAFTCVTADSAVTKPSLPALATYRLYKKPRHLSIKSWPYQLFRFLGSAVIW